MNACLLYPTDPLQPKVVDEAYAEEHAVAKARGFTVALVSLEQLGSKPLPFSGALSAGIEVIYRGWMLTPEVYERLMQAVERAGAMLMTRPEQYRLCHHLPNWYPYLSAFTAETRVMPRNADYVAELQGTDWPGYFVKDYVKSLSTGPGSLVDRPQEIAGIVALIERYRGKIEGGVCVRKREDFVAGTEQRHFVFKAHAYSIDGAPPPVVRECTSRISSPFFSVDTGVLQDGSLRLIEIGDGQVSDRKEWSADALLNMLAS